MRRRRMLGEIGALYLIGRSARRDAAPLREQLAAFICKGTPGGGCILVADFQSLLQNDVTN
jgi:hypothetical protein